MSAVVDLGIASVLAASAVIAWPLPQRGPWTPRDPHPGTGAGRAGLRVEAQAAERPGPAGATRGGTSSARPFETSTVHLVPEALELIALALAGGSSVGAAAGTVAATLPGRHARELGAVAQALRGGEEPAEAWSAAGPHWAVARRSLDLAGQAGVPPAEALVQAARDLRRDAVADVEVAAARLGVRLVVPLGLFYLPAFVLTTVVPVVLALTRDLRW